MMERIWRATEYPVNPVLAAGDEMLETFTVAQGPDGDLGRGWKVSPFVGAIFDVPNMSRVALEDTRQSLELLGPHLAYCHIGGSRPLSGALDEHGQRQWSWEFCALEEGIADIPQVVADLRAVGYDGYLVIEDFSACDPDLKLREGTAYLRRLLEMT